MKNKIPVTKPFLPDLKEFIIYLEKIWDNKILTNNGPFHKELEAALCNYLKVDYISLFNNATIALLIALKNFNFKKGEVITTPYSFVATSHSILLSGLSPVFVDIEKDTYNINPKKIEKAITKDTVAIMPVHCYGNPCYVDEIAEIANRYNLKVIYDAAHAFGVNIRGRSILRYGDLSILSFHATKVFNTFEGGAIISPNLETKKKIDLLKNFGILDETQIIDVGLNGKMSEVNAAFGLVQLKHISNSISKRKKIYNFYKKKLCNVKGISTPIVDNNIEGNYAYFPLIINEEYPLSRDELYDIFKKNNILCRRYFFPLLSNLPMYKNFSSSDVKNLFNANNIADRVLCIPIYDGLDFDIQEQIVSIILDQSNVII